MDRNFEGMRGKAVWNSKCQGVSSLNFHRGKTVEVSLEIADLIHFFSSL